MLPSAAVVALLATMLLPHSLVAQPVTGRVVDNASGEAIMGALVQLIAPDSTVLVSTLTDARGTFRFDRAADDDHFLRVTSLGYGDVRERIDRVATSDGAFLIRMNVSPIAISGVEARVTRSRWLDAHGFHDRQRLGIGTFITREMIESRHATANRAGQILRTLGGITVAEGFESEVVWMTRARASSLVDCPANIFVDGLAQGRELPRIHPLDIEAIEVYRGAAQVPPRFGGAEAGCGVVVIWLRAGAD